MKPILIAASIAFIACTLPVNADEAPPPWAFAVNPPGVKPAPDDGSVKRVPGSDAGFTLTQIRDLFHAPDWHPQAHPAMPDIVAFGNKENKVFACGFCHLPNGLGRPENANLAGLPAAYIEQQVADFRSGARRGSEPHSLPTNLMIAVAKSAGADEVKIAAQYFSQLPRTSWIKVIEANEVPKSHVAGWMLVADEPQTLEPIGVRIIEMPVDLERTELRDAASGFIAYAPVGSIERGRTLAQGGEGKTTRCSICHGEDLRGMGPIPGIAGRSPSYLVRQLYDLQHGVRAGPWTSLMKPVVEKLTMEDMVAVAAYAASLQP